MSVTTAIAVYFVLWWVVLFAVLPWGVRSQEESGSVSPGTDPGAPSIPALWRKVVWTTIATSAVFAVAMLLIQYRIVTLEGLAKWLAVPW